MSPDRRRPTSARTGAASFFSDASAASELLVAKVRLGLLAFVSLIQLLPGWHSAHLWGAIYGILFTLAMEPRVIGVFLRQLFNPAFLS